MTFLNPYYYKSKVPYYHPTPLVSSYCLSPHSDEYLLVNVVRHLIQATSSSHYFIIRSNKMKIFPAVLVFLFLACAVDSARILGIFAMPSRSHYILGSSLMRALAEHGHDVTMISPFGEKEPPKGGKYRDVILTYTKKEFEENQKNGSLNMFEMGDMGPFINIPFLAHVMSDIPEMTLKEPAVQELITSGEKFDAVIVEHFYNDALKSLAGHFDAVQIIFSSLGANYWMNPLVGNPSPLAYIPDIFLSYSSHMSFCERLTNTLVYLLNVGVHHIYLYPKNSRVSQEFIPNALDFYDSLYNTSLVLLNSHPSLNQPVPHVPNMVEIGGYHIKPPKKLPEDIQKFLDEAKHGVIYFSMGSNLKSADMSIEKRDAILKVFSKLKQKILWKWEEDVLPGQPENVKLGKWLPQQDILAHPNVKLFITHGGLLSTSETVYHGVPILAIPIFGDQKLNARNAVFGGYGLSLDYRDLNEEALREKLNDLLTNPKYAINVKSKSKIFHDREVKPLETAMYWVDYVVRHRGAPHLRVAALDLPWYQYLLLDVIAVLAAGALLSTVVFCFVAKKVCRRLCSKKTPKVKKN